MGLGVGEDTDVCAGAGQGGPNPLGAMERIRQAWGLGGPDCFTVYDVLMRFALPGGGEPWWKE